MIEALINCHNDNPYARFWGACNNHRLALDKCFTAEKDPKRAELRRKAREAQDKFSSELGERRARVEEFLAKREQQ